MKFDLAADLIEPDDYKKRIIWQGQMDKRPSSGSATVLMKAAEVQELDQQGTGQHPQPKRSDERKEIPKAVCENMQPMWELYQQRHGWPRPGDDIGISDEAADEARKKSEEQDRQNNAAADLGRRLTSLNFLKALGGTLSMTKESSQWQQLIIMVDSGASESVAPAGAATNVPIVESLGSRSGVTYEVANGQVIDNLGQKDCIVMARGGSSEQILSFQICEVHKPLLSVSKLLAVGKRVIFDDEWSYIEDKFTGERLTLVPKDGLFELHCWVRPEQDFPRPGRLRTTPHL